MPSTGECSSMMRAPVNKIIPFSNVDGPGNRTSIFFQGCTFDCLFCHNPETIRLCPHDSSPKIRWMTVEEVLQEVRRAAPYIVGITVSGGECTLQNEFLLALFREVRELGKTCLIDSNGSFDFERDPRILEVSEGVMLDVKAVGQHWSDELISHPREIVLKNLDYLLGVGKLWEVRTVIFPNRDRENEETVRYVAEHIRDACPYRIIRYRPYGVRERGQELLGTFETDASYAEHFVQLARELGAEKAFLI